MSECPIREEILDALTTDTDAQLPELCRHAEQCPDCGELLPLLRESDPPALAPPSSFAGSVMDRTVGGSACRQAAESLVDPPADRVGAQLLRSHVDDCTPCGELERALRRLAVDLPLMAEIDPGPAFTATVVTRTSGLAVPGEPTTVERLRRALVAFARRPRFAFELSYVGALVVWVLFGVSDFASVTRLTSWVQEAPATVVQETGQLTLDTAQFVGRSAEKVRGALNERVAATAGTRQSLAQTGQEFRDTALDLVVGRTSKLAGELGSQLIRLPQQFLTEPVAPEETPLNDDDNNLPKESNDERSG